MVDSWAKRFSSYSLRGFRSDLISGAVVGIVAIPLAMAFAIASGVKPEYGIYTTIIAGVLISLFGGSRYQIGGPTGAFVPILLSIVLSYGYSNLLIAGFMAGIILLLLGVFRLGSLIAYIPQPVTIGFTAGIGVTIFSGQIPSFLGLGHLKKHDTFLPNMLEIARHISQTDLTTVIVSITCLCALLLTQKYLPRIPSSLVGLVTSTLVATFVLKHSVSTIGSTYGAIPSSLPSFHHLTLSASHVLGLLGPAFVIAMLGGIESLLSAVVADGMTHTRHDSNQELIGQGIANIVTPFFGGIPATGAIARTATNIRSGSVSPISGIIHGISVAIILLTLSPLASRIPLASMAPILMVVAWNMSERKEFVRVLRMRTSDSLVLIITFALTVFANLTLAVGVGILLSIAIFAKNMGKLVQVSKVLPDHANKHQRVGPHVVTESHDCPQIAIFTVEGPLFFAAARAFEHTLTSKLHVHPRVLLLRMSKVPFLDSTGESYLSSIARRCEHNGITVLFSGLTPQPNAMMTKSGLVERIGKDQFFERTGHAIQKAMTQLDYNQCTHCSHFAFKECHQLSTVQPQAQTLHNSGGANES